MTTVLDASVVAKCFVREEGSGEALEALGRAGELIAPDLLVAELSNVAWKKVRRGEIDATHAARMVRAVPSMFVRLVPSATLVARALEIALELDHPVYDCLYLALAEAEDATLVTDDGRLRARAASTTWSDRVVALRP